MKKTFLPVTVTSALLSFPITSHAELVISAVFDGPLPGGQPKGIELFTNTEINDLSLYGVGSANNGDGSDGKEFSFTNRSLAAGSYIYITSNTDAFETFFGFTADYTSEAMSINGDDAIELFEGDTLIDIFGESDVEGGDWNYKDGWAKRLTNTPANAGNFNIANWTLSGIGAWEGAADNASSTTPLPLGNSSTGTPPSPPEPTPLPANLGQCGDTAILISAIQGSGDSSSQQGSEVIIEGVVTGIRSNGFFVQEEAVDNDNNDATSEGIFVEDEDLSAITMGHTIRVLGTPEENFGNTQITASAFIDCGAAETQIPALALSLPLAENFQLETIEGMLVSVNNASVTDVFNLGRFGQFSIDANLKWVPSDREIPLSDAYNILVKNNSKPQLLVEDNTTSEHPNGLNFIENYSYTNSLAVGDKISVEGPINFAFGDYRISAISDIQRVDSARDEALDLQPADVSIATFNVLNYFNGQVQDDGSITYNFPENRGATKEEEFSLQEARIVSALIAIDADVVGLVEIENDGFGESSAMQSLVTALNTQLESSKAYSFISTDSGNKIGTDAITNGLLYRASVVEPQGALAIIDMPEQTFEAVRDGRDLSLDLSSGTPETIIKRMRPAIVQTFTHTASGDRFAVSVNHFKSKGSECYEDLSGGSEAVSELAEIQGSCSAFRVSAAITLGEALNNLNLPDKVLIVGDLNSYTQEDPIAVLTDYNANTRGYMIQTAIHTAMNNGESVAIDSNYAYVRAAEAFDPGSFSYTFRGECGSLDHVLASSAAMNAITDLDHWNINSIETSAFQANRLFHDETSDYHQANYYDVGPYRSSDHDPVVISLAMMSQEGEEPEGEDRDGGGSMPIWILLTLFMAIFTRRFYKA